MRKVIITLFCILPTCLFGALPLKKVVLFPNGAELTREGSGQVTAGEGVYTIMEIPDLMTNSVSVTVLAPEGASVSLLDVILQPTVQPPQDNSKQVLSLQDELAARQLEIASLTRQQSALTQYQAGIVTPDKSRATSFSELATNLQASEERLATIGQKLVVAKRELQKLEQQLQALEEMQRAPQRRRGISLCARISAERNTQVNYHVRYMIREARWTPSYEIRGTDKAMMLDYRGMVQQTTGEDWTQVPLELSTSMPSSFVAVPKLRTWYLLGQQPMGSRSWPAKGNSVAAGSRQEDTGAYGLSQEKMVAANAPEAQVEESTLATTYVIRTPATIPSGTEWHKVSIKEVEMTYNAYYDVAPKVSLKAILRADITNNSNLHLLPGTCNLFYNDAFVGQTRLAMAPREQCSIALGEDPRIQVERTSKPQKIETSLLGTVTKTYEESVTIKNLTSRTNAFVVHGQIPISRHEKIEVQVQDPASKPPSDTGEILWSLQMSPGQQMEIPLKFTVAHPKSLPITEVYQ